jgi:hypothetical protein
VIRQLAPHAVDADRTGAQLDARSDTRRTVPRVAAPQ